MVRLQSLPSLNILRSIRKKIHKSVVIVITRNSVNRDFGARHTLVHKHHLTLPSRTFILKGKANWLHFTKAYCPSITLVFIDMFRPQAHRAMVTIYRPHMLVYRYPAAAVSAREAARRMLGFPLSLAILSLLPRFLVLDHMINPTTP
jgi:hypothetical protein